MGRNVGRLILALIVLLAIGVLVLPTTVSLFAGQHNWYNITPTGNQVPCQKCHADVFEELNNNPYHKGLDGDNTSVSESDCTGCHQANTSITFANGTANQPGQEAHAAALIECMYCHGNTTVAQSVGAPIAGGFGLSDYNVTPGNDSGSLAAHKDFVETASSQGSILLAENEACIACHTHVAVKINFTHYKAMNFDVTWDSVNSEYTTSNYAINTSTGAVYKIWGNAAGNGGMVNNTTATTTWGTGTWP